MQSPKRNTLTSVMSNWYATCLLPRLEREEQLEAVARGWYRWHQLSTSSGTDDAAVAGKNGVAERQTTKMLVRRERLTMSIASIYIRTAFDVARPSGMYDSGSFYEKRQN